MQSPIAVQQNDQKGGGKEKPPEEPRLDIDVGEYSPELGYSYGEIGAISRSTNRSQGQGTAERKGSQKQALITIGGDKATKDIFDGNDITWNRIPGGAAVGALLKQTLDSFVPAHPEAMLAALAQARPMVAALVDRTKDPLAVRKLQELDETIALASGLSVDAQAAAATVTPGATLRVNITAIRRSSAPITLTAVSLSGMDGAPALKPEPVVLADNPVPAKLHVERVEGAGQRALLATVLAGAAKGRQSLRGSRPEKHRTRRERSWCWRLTSR